MYVMPCACFWWPMDPFPPSSKSLPEGKEHKHPNTVLNTSVSHKTNQELKHLAYRCTLRWNIHIHIRPNNREVRKIMDSKVPWLVGDMLVSFFGWYSFPEDKIRFSRKYLGIPVIAVAVIGMNLQLPLPESTCCNTWHESSNIDTKPPS